MATQLKGCKRGVFGLDSWETGEIPQAILQNIQSSVAANQGPKKAENTSAKKTVEPPSVVPKPNEKIAAKHTYRANPNSPIGQELSLTPGCYLRFLKVADCNNHWWYCKNEAGEEGYVPATYCITVRVTGLPWLQNREPEPEPAPVKGAYKPYVPTYDLKGVAHGTDRYNCELCGKYFNGPLPYNTHMKSKAHKEEVEIAQAYQNS